MSDLARKYPVVFSPNVNNIEQSFGKDDNELKRIYVILNSLRGWYKSGTPPTSPNVGDKWQDSSLTPNVVREFDGKTWGSSSFIIANASYADKAGNADMLEGKYAADFAPKGYGLGVSVQKSDININTLMFSGFYYLITTCSNIPEQGYGLLTVNGIGNDCDQRYTSLSSGKIYTRFCINGAWWSPWKQLATTDQIPARTQVAVLTGTIANGGTIPLPNGYTQDQCKWTVSANHIYDSQGGQWTDCSADENRLVKLTAGTANYMIIGVK